MCAAYQLHAQVELPGHDARSEQAGRLCRRLCAARRVPGTGGPCLQRVVLDSDDGRRVHHVVGERIPESSLHDRRRVAHSLAGLFPCRHKATTTPRWLSTCRSRTRGWAMATRSTGVDPKAALPGALPCKVLRYDSERRPRAASDGCHGHCRHASSCCSDWKSSETKRRRRLGGQPACLPRQAIGVERRGRRCRAPRLPPTNASSTQPSRAARREAAANPARRSSNGVVRVVHAADRPSGDVSVANKTASHGPVRAMPQKQGGQGGEPMRRGE